VNSDTVDSFKANLS